MTSDRDIRAAAERYGLTHATADLDRQAADRLSDALVGLTVAQSAAVTEFLTVADRYGVTLTRAAARDVILQQQGADSEE